MNDYQLISFIPLSTYPILPKTWDARLRKTGGTWRTICVQSHRIALSYRLWKVQGLGGVIALFLQPQAQHPLGVISVGLEKSLEAWNHGRGRQAGCPFKAFPSSFFTF